MYGLRYSHIRIKDQQLNLNMGKMEKILDHNPVIQRSIQFRNPFTYPLNVIQTELIQRWVKRDINDQNQEKILTELLFLNINSIAAAMQSTG